MIPYKKMPYEGLNTFEGNLNSPPEEIRVTPSEDGRHVMTFADMHGNCIKLIWQLMAHGYITMNKSSYKELLEIYDATGAAWRRSKKEESEELEKIDLNLTRYVGEEINEYHNELAQKSELLAWENDIKRRLSRFKEILTNDVIYIGAGSMFRMLGDVLSDRGSCDLLTLEFLQILESKGIYYNASIGNHDNGMLYTYGVIAGFIDKQTEEYLNWGSVGSRGQDNSMQSVRDLIEFKIIDKEYLKKLLVNYVNNLKIVDYNVDQKTGKLNLFVHSPVPYETIKKLGEVILGPGNFDDTSSLEKMIESLDKLNKAFNEALTSGEPKEIWGMIKETDEVTNMIKKIDGGPKDLKYPPYYKETLWTDKTVCNEDHKLSKFVNKIYHGHTAEESCANEKYCNLDSNFGKVDRAYEGSYSVLSTTENLTLKQKINTFLTERQKQERINKLFTEIIKKVNSIDDLTIAFGSISAEDQTIILTRLAKTTKLLNIFGRNKIELIKWLNEHLEPNKNNIVKSFDDLLNKEKIIASPNLSQKAPAQNLSTDLVKLKIEKDVYNEVKFCLSYDFAYSDNMHDMSTANTIISNLFKLTGEKESIESCVYNEYKDRRVLISMNIDKDKIPLVIEACKEYGVPIDMPIDMMQNELKKLQEQQQKAPDQNLQENLLSKEKIIASLNPDQKATAQYLSTVPIKLRITKSNEGKFDLLYDVAHNDDAPNKADINKKNAIMAHLFSLTETKPLILNPGYDPTKRKLVASMNVDKDKIPLLIEACKKYGVHIDMSIEVQNELKKFQEQQQKVIVQDQPKDKVKQQQKVQDRHLQDELLSEYKGEPQKTKKGWCC